MSKHYILLAIDKKDGIAKYIDDVPNGKNCGCVCAECNGELIAKNNGKVKIHHFAHSSGNDSVKCSQTALHRLAKKIVVEEKLIPAFNNGQLEFVNVSLVEEEKDLEDIRPDLYAEYNGKPIAIEIFVSHAVNDEKFEKIQKHKLTTFEIDLSNLEYVTCDEVKKALYNPRNIRVVYDEEIVSGYLNLKRQFILQKGMEKSVNNGIVKDCPMRVLIKNGLFAKLRDVEVNACAECFFGFVSDLKSKVHCLGYLNSNEELPQWFLHTDLNEKRFLSMRELSEKMSYFMKLSKKM